MSQLWGERKKLSWVNNAGWSRSLSRSVPSCQFPLCELSSLLLSTNLSTALAIAHHSHHQLTSLQLQPQPQPPPNPLIQTSPTTQTMVQSPESSFFAPTTQRKRRRDDHFPDAPSSSLKPWGYIPEHRPLHLLPSKFSTTPSSPPTQKLKTTHSRTASPPHRPRSSPKLKRPRASPPTQYPEEDYQMVISSPPQPLETAKQPERCHVCSRVQSLVMPSFGTITACAVCAERTCYVCTRKCDSCDETVCSKCAEEKEVHSFCRRCMGAWKDSRGGGSGMM